MPNEQIGLLGNQKTGYMQGVASIGNLLVTIIDSQIFVSSLEGVQVLQEYIYSHQ
ncbi:hypothetical protein ACFY5J_03485 [Peribacillus butanolivorans]|uniref:hypothetical protein n=1 Tax=Peribacillus butanolivorans TaxID=421767 RepID=UPI0036C84B73|nr:hypothetical protein [Peribacillus butanolivorans]